MPKNKHALIAMSGFKGTLSNDEACKAVQDALTEMKISSVTVPISDGGKGTINTLKSALKGELKSFSVHDAYKNISSSSVLCFPNKYAPKDIYIESADTCGTLPTQEKKALAATSSGMGKLILQCLSLWPNVETIYVGLGDSAISDCGLGMLSELGITFYDKEHRKLSPETKNLIHIHHIAHPKNNLVEKTWIILCDVLNPLCGENGSASVFSAQKGASAEEVALIKEGMENFAKVIKRELGRTVQTLPMTGSCGGLSTAFYVFLGAQLLPGAPFLLDVIRFEDFFENASFVITGEGKTDSQTLSGKSSYEVLLRAKEYGIPAYVVSGQLGAGHENLKEAGLVKKIVECGKEPDARNALKRAVSALIPKK